MRKASEIIAIALLPEHGYLRSYTVNRDKGYLCYVLADLVAMDVVSLDDAADASKAIYESLEYVDNEGITQQAKFLIIKLLATGEIAHDRSDYFTSYEYRIAAFKHWNNLIEKLKSEGL